MLSLLGLTFLPSAFEIDQGLEKFQNPYFTYMSILQNRKNCGDNINKNFADACVLFK